MYYIMRMAPHRSRRSNRTWAASGREKKIEKCFLETPGLTCRATLARLSRGKLWSPKRVPLRKSYPVVRYGQSRGKRRLGWFRGQSREGLNTPHFVSLSANIRPLVLAPAGSVPAEPECEFFCWAKSTHRSRTTHQTNSADRRGYRSAQTLLCCCTHRAYSVALGWFFGVRAGLPALGVSVWRLQRCEWFMNLLLWSLSTLVVWKCAVTYILLCDCRGREGSVPLADANRLWK